MTNRERFLNIMHFCSFDEMPFLQLEPNESATLDGWAREAGITHLNPQDYFGIVTRIEVPLSFYPLPTFERNQRDEGEDYIHFTDYMGTTVRAHRKKPNMYYGHIDHPVKTRTDWEKYKKRLIPNLEQRLPIDWGEEIDQELDRIIPIVKEGGFLPALDDMVPEEVPLRHYEYFVKAFRRLKP